jgi:dipeptidyl-peptidase-4
MFKKLRSLTAVLALAGVAIAAPGYAQISANLQEMLKKIAAGEFGAGGRGAGGGGRWVDGGTGYLAVERNAAGGVDIVRYETATGTRSVVMSAGQLTPPQLGKPLQVTDFAWSADGKRMIVAANGRPTMIRKTAFDYWVLDKTDNSWRKLGGEAAANGVLYAKLSPDATRAAYVRDNNLYVEDVKSGAITQLTSDGSASIINGTSDWVYEEELSLRDAFEWSPAPSPTEPMKWRNNS